MSFLISFKKIIPFLDKKLKFSQEMWFYLSVVSALPRVHPLLKTLKVKQPFPSLRSLSHQLYVSLPACLSVTL